MVYVLYSACNAQAEECKEAVKHEEFVAEVVVPHVLAKLIESKA